MSTAKEDMTEIIARQPDDSSYDEILRELAYASMIKRGIKQADAGETISDDVMKRRIESWQK